MIPFLAEETAFRLHNDSHPELGGSFVPRYVQAGEYSPAENEWLGFMAWGGLAWYDPLFRCVSMLEVPDQPVMGWKVV